MHILGYGLDLQSPTARKLTETQAAARDERMEIMIGRLNRLGVELSVGEVRAEANGRGGSVGRPHVARLLIRKGYAKSNYEAFQKYLGGGGAAYVDNLPFTAEQAIALIRAAGGLASLAHPLQLRRQSFAQTEALVRELAEQGMEGLETIHSGHDADTVARLTRLADRLELLTTGGSDYHGTAKTWIRLGEAAGRRPIPRSFLDAIMGRLRGRAGKAGSPRRHEDTKRSGVEAVVSPAPADGPRAAAINVR
jgi:hypothetical protein